jgi:hypothetical protein
MSDFRVWTTVPGLPFEGDVSVRLHRWLDRHCHELGPVLAGDLPRDGTVVILATAAVDEAQAARIATERIVEGLQSIGLGDRWPAALEVERIEPEGSPAAV